MTASLHWNKQTVMSVETKVLRPEDADKILSFEMARLEHLEPMQREFASWSAPWRKESLEHYLPLGWCFGMWESSELVGYYMAQPFLFFRGMTQTLWLEHMNYRDLEIGKKLADLAYRASREKHLQVLLVNNEIDRAEVFGDLKYSKISDKILEVLTAKIKR